MQFSTSTLRGPGVQRIHGGGRIRPDVITLIGQGYDWRALRISLTDHAEVTIRVDELSAMVEFLRSKGIEIDPLREKQKKVAWALANSFDTPEAEKRPQP